MKIYKTQQEIDADVRDGQLLIEGDVQFGCNFSIKASIKIKGSISARDISARDISAENISARDISARDISARDISARDISAENISAENISARDISAWDISFYAVCFAYVSLKCKSISGRRNNAKYGCLDGEVIIK